jgi:hypothetical protein
MPFVIIEKNTSSVPSDQDIRQAMSDSGGAVTAVDGNNASKNVTYTGEVNHTVFENNLIKVAKGKRTSWNFTFADRAGADTGAGTGVLSLADYQPNGVQAANGGLGATQYEIDITMSPATVTALVDGNFNLYGFKAVQTTQGGGAPLVWFQLPRNDYSTLTQVIWSVQYQAYTSRSKIIPNGKVTASFSTEIDLGQTLSVVDGGTGDVTKGGPKQAVSISNTTTTQFTCGISQRAADGSTNPMCAFPLYGQHLDVIAPIEKVLLIFSTTPVNTGTVIEQAYSPGVLVDLTSSNERTVAYDINKGWSWGGYSWGRAVAATEALVPLLIETAQVSGGTVVEPLALVLG